mmetsp:Transcript_53245/g.116144  ORF Transcript_53245/g.116144 Transcript_53245/m.116144 type:complete len:235 (+) Transcript_53245:1184-1888(+)
MRSSLAASLKARRSCGRATWETACSSFHQVARTPISSMTSILLQSSSRSTERVITSASWPFCARRLVPRPSPPPRRASASSSTVTPICALPALNSAPTWKRALLSINHSTHSGTRASEPHGERFRTGDVCRCLWASWKQTRSASGHGCSLGHTVTHGLACTDVCNGRPSHIEVLHMVKTIPVQRKAAWWQAVAREWLPLLCVCAKLPRGHASLVSFCVKAVFAVRLARGISPCT